MDKIDENFLLDTLIICINSLYNDQSASVRIAAGKGVKYIIEKNKQFVKEYFSEIFKGV